MRGQADDEAARQLEIEMLEDEDLFQRVQTEDLLCRGLEQSEASSGATGTRRQPPLRVQARTGWALAAGFAAATVLLGIYSLQLNEQLESMQAPTVGVPVITFFEQRSLLPAADEPRFELSAHEGPALLEIDVSGYTHASFDLEIISRDQTTAWKEQLPDERGYLTVLVPNAGKVESMYVRSSDGELLKSYSFRKE